MNNQKSKIEELFIEIFLFIRRYKNSLAVFSYNTINPKRNLYKYDFIYSFFISPIVFFLITSYVGQLLIYMGEIEINSFYDFIENGEFFSELMNQIKAATFESVFLNPFSYVIITLILSYIINVLGSIRLFKYLNNNIISFHFFYNVSISFLLYSLSIFLVRQTPTSFFIYIYLIMIVLSILFVTICCIKLCKILVIRRSILTKILIYIFNYCLIANIFLMPMLKEKIEENKVLSEKKTIMQKSKDASLLQLEKSSNDNEYIATISISNNIKENIIIRKKDVKLYFYEVNKKRNRPANNTKDYFKVIDVQWKSNNESVLIIPDGEAACLQLMFVSNKKVDMEKYITETKNDYLFKMSFRSRLNKSVWGRFADKYLIQ